MLHPLIVLVAEEAFNAVFIFEIQISEDAVPLDDLIEDIEVQRQLINALHLLNKLSANRASHPEIMVENLEALCAKSVATVNKDAWNSFANVEVLSAVIAEVKPTSPIVALYNNCRLLLLLHSFRLLPARLS